jgi:hypothetical protein
MLKVHINSVLGHLNVFTQSVLLRVRIAVPLSSCIIWLRFAWHWKCCSRISNHFRGLFLPSEVPVLSRVALKELFIMGVAIVCPGVQQAPAEAPSSSHTVSCWCSLWYSLPTAPLPMLVTRGGEGPLRLSPLLQAGPLLQCSAQAQADLQLKPHPCMVPLLLSVASLSS